MDNKENESESWKHLSLPADVFKRTTAAEKYQGQADKKQTVYEMPYRASTRNADSRWRDDYRTVGLRVRHLHGNMLKIAPKQAEINR